MQFALLGDHSDGLDFACTLAQSGRHDLAIFSGSAAGLAHLQRHGLTPRVIVDLEEVLADPGLDVVIVAGHVSVRPAQLRRAIQSEAHVLCVHPADPSPDVAYEAAMIQADTGRVLLPLLPMTFHPGVIRFAELAGKATARLIELEIWSTEEVLLEGEHEGHKPSLPGWDVLRSVGGEIGELYLQSPQAEARIGVPLLLSGRFVNETLFQASFVPNQAAGSWRMSLVTTTGRATLQFGQGWPGPAQLTYADDKGELFTETWEALSPWQAMLAYFEDAVELAALKKPLPGQPNAMCLTKAPSALGWQDELRALELDDAARRSAEKGRANTLDLQEATEEASFKGTMTLVGCSLIWLTVVVLILSMWLPMLAWLILPVMGVFLLLQALRWIVPTKE